MAAKREILKNNPTTTLAEGLDDTETVITVTDGSVFPSTGNFRVIVEDEIMLCTGRSTNDLTVERGAESSVAATHADGTAISQILTEDGLEAYIRQDNPFHNDTRTPFRIVDANGTVLTTSDFTKTDGSNAATPVDQGGRIFIEKDSSAATPDYTLMRRTKPASPCVLVGAFRFFSMVVGSGSHPSCGLFFRESSTGEFVTIDFGLVSVTNGSGFVVNVRKMNSPTSSNSYYSGTASSTIFINVGPEIWLRIEDDGSNLIFKIGHDGINWQQVHSVSRTDFMAGGPDEWGFHVNNENNVTWNAFATLVAYDEGAT